MRKRTLSLLPAVGFALCLWGQPVNDECTNPIVIPDVTNFCSSANAFTNSGATPSSYGPAACFGASTQNDVWFAFTAEFTDVSVSVRGAAAQSPGGTLQDPQIAIYFGTCGGTINELECQSAPGNTNIAEAYQGGLFVGSTYLVRVQGAAGQTGTFQLCVNNYNPPVEPTSDCPTASILCDKSPFAVQSVTGAGSNIAEMNDANCFANGAPTNYESNSTWFVWTCSQSGPLEMTLNPLNPTDDLDFAIYRLPNGIGNCQGKQLLRCMASGQTTGANSAACLGPTGLRAGDPDISEDAGCSDAGDDAWLAPLDMVAGESYTLVVNNFSSTGNGFSIEFGGSGEFLGPEAQFTTIPSAICLDENIQVVDGSVFSIGSITGWKWSFGSDALPQSATGQGPHTVSFSSPGIHPVVLTLETNLGCKVTEIQQVTVFPDVEVDTLIGTPDCNGGSNGTITIQNITMGTPPYEFSWNGGPFGPNASLSGLTEGVYMLQVRDANNCKTDLSINVQEKILRVAPDITKPLCFGDDNGIITLNVTNGTPPFLFDWGSGPIPQNSQGGYAAGIYTILGSDAELCEGVFTVTVTDNPPITLSVDTTNVSCFGAADGSSQATPGGGVGNYTYNWSDGQQSAQAGSLGPGQYFVTVQDGNGCTITEGVWITEPADVGINLLGVTDLICNDVPNGEVRVEGVGGAPPYTYGINGTANNTSGVIGNLAAGDYWVIVRDANGCTDSVAASVIQPPPLTVVAMPSDITLDLGYTQDISTVYGPSDRMITYLWSPYNYISCSDCPDPTVTGVNNIVYLLQITDQDGCIAFDTVRVTVNKERPVYFPNIIAPDGQFPNNFFTGFAGPAAERMLLFRIYDRWGSLVFEGRDISLNEPNIGWDGMYRGKPLTGVFTWYAVVRFVDQEEITYEGNVTVLR